MDDLVSHCLREIAFDGDLGSAVSRLHDFIREFYKPLNYAQALDEDFQAFVWSLIVQQPTVRVGIKPPGLTTEVYIAPQLSAQKKAKAKGEEVADVVAPELILIPDARLKTLSQLKAEYQDDLRIALEPEAVCSAITGSHVRPPKLTPMVYTSLQLITRGREDGITVMALGQTSGYDQKTCFYLVKQLLELDLVVKVRRAGVGANFCLHKHFFNKGSVWKEVREEVTKWKETEKVIEEAPAETQLDEEAAPSASLPDFPPIDTRHLSSLDLLRARVTKLLKMSKNYMYPAVNIMKPLGFANPSKTDRRFFNRRMAELVAMGIIDKVILPTGSRNYTVKCYRLITEDTAGNDSLVKSVADDEDDLGQSGPSDLRVNVSLHKQLIDIIEESGTKGATLNDLSVALGDFDKRTLELLLSRAEKFPPPPHLGDLAISTYVENKGRERRYIYITTAFQQQLLREQNFQDESVPPPEEHPKGFMYLDPALFYNDEAQLIHHQDFSKGAAGVSPKKPIGRPRKNPLQADGKSAPRKRKIAEVNGSTNTLLSTTSTKKRRVGDSSALIIGDSDIDGIAMEEDTSKPTPKKRGRPPNPKDDTPKEPKKRGRPPKPKDDTPQVPKKRGRPPKKKPEEALILDGPALAQTEEGGEAVVNPPINEPGGLLPEQSDVTMTSAHQPTPPPNTSTPEETVVAADAAALQTEHILPDQDEEVQETEARELPASTSTKRVGKKPKKPEVISKRSVRKKAAKPMEPVPEPPTPVVTEALPLEGEQTVESTAAVNISMPNVPETVPESTLQANNPSVEAELTTNPVKLSTEVPPPDQAVAQPIAPSPQDKVSFVGPAARTRGPRINISALRREQEFVRLLEIHGGIMNISNKEFYKAHSELLQQRQDAGEPTSMAPGTQVDRRTLNATFDSMENRGLLKILKTSVANASGTMRQVCIIHQPQLDQAAINSFLVRLDGITPLPEREKVTRIEERMDYGTDTPNNTRIRAAVEPSSEKVVSRNRKECLTKSISGLDKLLKEKDEVIREGLLEDIDVLHRIYGYVRGRIRRARKLHLLCMEAIEAETTSQNVVSKESQIINLAFFHSDISVEDYCSIVSVLTPNENLMQLLSSEEERKKPVGQLSEELAAPLQLLKAHSRNRILDALETLRLLGLVVALNPSSSQTPDLRGASLRDQPTSFDFAASDALTSISVPITHIQFSRSTPLNWWRSDDFPLPPENLPTTSTSQCLSYWVKLEKTSVPNRDPEVFPELGLTNPDPDQCAPAARELVKLISKPRNWSEADPLAYCQTRYLDSLIDTTTGSTPLDREGADEEIKRIAWVCCAPVQVVTDYLERCRDRMVAMVARAKRGRKSVQSDPSLHLAQLAADAKRQRQREWDELVQSLHPDPVSGPLSARFGRIRKRFLESALGKDDPKWTEQIQATIREAYSFDDKLPKSLRKAAAAANQARQTHVSMPPQTTNPPVKSVQDLITQQRQLLSAQPSLVEKLANSTSKKRKRDQSANDTPTPGTPTTPATRRSRSQWNKDYEELAQDAYAIIRARCRIHSRVDFTALEQVFPAIPRNGVRQHVVASKNTNGNEAYLQRLEDSWFEFWMRYQGTDVLLDPNPNSMSDFDLALHIEVLRKHIDKNALRVGFYQPNLLNQVELPADLGTLLERFEVKETIPQLPSYDYIWNAVKEESRENSLIQQPFTHSNEEDLYVYCAANQTSDRLQVAEAALKMVMGTPEDQYQPEAASALLKDIGEESVDIATKNLLSKNVLAKLVRDSSKQRPGRQLKINEVNQNALGGALPWDLFQDASALEYTSADQDDSWREWPLVCTDGDVAGLLQLASEDKVDFKIDVSVSSLARGERDWNSKKTDDDDLETAVHVRFFDLQPSHDYHDTSTPPMDISEAPSALVPHGKTDEGHDACCALNEVELADCTGCLHDVNVLFMSRLTPEMANIAVQVHTLIYSAGEKGVTATTLQSVNPEHGMELVHQMMCLVPTPLCFWGGYMNRVVVHSRYMKTWTVLISENPQIRILPRRWRSIDGGQMNDIWEAAVHAVSCVVVFKPGISQAELQWRLRSIYDKPEVDDVLRFLEKEDIIKKRYTTDIPDEISTFWFLDGGRHWYHV